jgi:transposase
LPELNLLKENNPSIDKKGWFTGEVVAALNEKHSIKIGSSSVQQYFNKSLGKCWNKPSKRK